MVTPPGYNSCDQIQSYFTLYPVPVAALLWCGVPQEQVNNHLTKASETKLRGVLSLSYMKCFEPRCRAIHNAIEAGVLPVCREKGVHVTDHVAPERRHVKRENLKAWIAKEFPDDKPDFLFDKIEKNTHSAINSQAFQTLQADRDAKTTELVKAKERAQQILSERDDLLVERDALKSCIDKMEAESRTINQRSETTYLNIIGAMLNLMLSSSPAGKKHSVFDNQAAIISVLLGYYGDRPGISDRTLEAKFSEAKKSLSTS